MYEPKPINTEDVALTTDILELSGLIAKNVHDVWAVGRIAQGWTYGPVRNDALKQTPCLVPYEELTDEEKSYDLNTALETLKLIVKLGYKIVKEEG